MMTNLKNITAEEIIEQLSEAVNEHRLKPGAKLREDEVSEVLASVGLSCDRLCGPWHLMVC